MNLLRRGDYWTQTNNPTKPMAACMPTARVMFYIANRVSYVNPSLAPDDDYFMRVLNTDLAREVSDEKYPHLVEYPPNEIHGMYHTFLDWIACGKRVSDFVDDLTFEDYVSHVKSGNAIMTSCATPQFPGHARVATGYDSSKKELIFADPFYGYEYPMNEEDFNRWVKPLNSKKKWGHVPIFK